VRTGKIKSRIIKKNRNKIIQGEMWTVRKKRALVRDLFETTTDICQESLASYSKKLARSSK
jgi:hypothetical protein